MGSILRFTRPSSIARRSVTSAADEAMAREEAASLTILLWTFGASAVVMCSIVVVMLSRSWREFAFIGAFVLVLVLLKIALANALFYVMVHCDKDRDRGTSIEPEPRPTIPMMPPPRPVRLRVRRAVAGRRDDRARRVRPRPASNPVQ